MTDGKLYKESNSRIPSIKGLYRQVFVTIDFTKHLIRFKQERKDVNFQSGKDIAFDEVLEVNKLELDVYKDELKNRNKLPFRRKFAIRTIKRTYFFFANTHIERDIWIESFVKVI